MRIGIPAEIYPGETRVAATPETVKKLTAGGRHTVIVQTGAGAGASIPDADFTAAGATIGCAADVYSQSDIVLKVRRPEPSELPLLRRGSILVGLLSPHEGVDGPRRDRRHRLRHGAAAAHHARADHGRAVVAGQHRRLQSGARRAPTNTAASCRC